MKIAHKILLILLAICLLLGSYYYSVSLMERAGDTYLGVSESFTAYVAMVVATPEERDIQAEIASIDAWYNRYLSVLEESTALESDGLDLERFNNTYALWLEIAPKLTTREALPEEAVLKLMDITKAMLSELPEARFSELREILEVNP